MREDELRHKEAGSDWTWLALDFLFKRAAGCKLQSPLRNTPELRKNVLQFGVVLVFWLVADLFGPPGSRFLGTIKRSAL